MPQKKPIRVLLVDDHAVVRNGLGTLLMVFDDLEFVGEASNGHEAIRACSTLQPDVVLMDLLMPEMDGVSATREIHARWPQIKVLVLTSFKEDALVKGAMRAGAMGYLLKNIAADDLASAIRTAAAGLPTLAPEAAQVLIKAACQVLPTEEEEQVELTSREKEVLVLMGKGMNNLEIANRLVISRSTVKFHVSRILTKLQASSRTEAVAIALQKQLVNIH